MHWSDGCVDVDSGREGHSIDEREVGDRNRRRVENRHSRIFRQPNLAFWRNLMREGFYIRRYRRRNLVTGTGAEFGERTGDCFTGDNASLDAVSFGELDDRAAKATDAIPAVCLFAL